MSNDWKERLGIVYSTNPDFIYDTNRKEESDTPPPEKQRLIVVIDKKQRKGKVVTLVQGFVGKQDDLRQLAKILKTKCGVGGSGKDGEIIIQGDLIEKIKKILKEQGYGVK